MINLSRTKCKSSIKFHTIELVSAICCVILIVCAVVAEILHLHKIDCIMIYSDDFKDLTMNILQIQAGVSTITVALIALISGMISEEIYGISITRYYMIIRPKWFGQMKIVLLTLSLDFIGVIFEILKLKYMICACFFIEWILIVVLIIEIFPVFYGKKTCEIEIKQYIGLRMTESDFEDKTVINTIFIESWLMDIECNDFEERRNLLKCGIENILLEESDSAIDYVNDNIEKLIRNHLKHNEHWVVCRGFLLLDTVYECIWHLLYSNKIDTGKTTSCLLIFQNLYHDITSALMKLDMKEIEEYYSYDYIFDTSARVTAYYLQNDKDACRRELMYIENYAFLLGKFIGLKLGEKQRELDEADTAYWSEMLDNIRISKTYIPADMVPLFMMHRCKVYFSYIASLINAGMYNLIVKCFYGSGEYIFYDDIYHLLLCMSVQCYIYYLAEAEDVNIVPEKGRICAQELLAQKEKAAFQFESLIERVSINEMKVFKDNDFERLMGEVLKKFEIYNMGHIKQVVMPDTITLWYVSLILYSHEKYVYSGNLIDYLHGNILVYVNQFLRYDTLDTADKIVNIYQLLSVSRVNDIERKRMNLYEKLRRALIEKYKEMDINAAQEAQCKFIANDKETKMVEDIRNSVMKNLKATFAPIVDDSIERTNEIALHLLDLHDETEYLDKNTISGWLGRIEADFCGYIEHELLKSGKAKQYNCHNKTDEEYVSYLRKQNIAILIGSEYELRNRSYLRDDAFDEFKKNCDCIYLSVNNVIALAKGKLKISIKSLDVSIRSGDLNEDNISIDKETGQYKVRFFDNIEAVFDKREAEEYVKNKFKVISITARVATQIEDNAGVIILRK